MKREFVLLALMSLFLTNVVFAETDSCDPRIQLLSQDPYPAVPGDYVKLVFQIDKISDDSCGELFFELVDNYPISFDPDQDNKVELKTGTFVREYPTHKIAVFKARVDSLAVDGDSPIDILLSKKSSSLIELKKFNLNIMDTQANFEIYVKNFNFATNEITLEILNTAKANIKSATIEIIPSDSVIVKGPRTKIVGDLDSNEYTTFDFEVSPEIADIYLKIYYTDDVGHRREVDSKVSFDPSYFKGRKTPEKSSNPAVIIFAIVVIFLIGYRIYKKRKKKK